MAAAPLEWQLLLTRPHPHHRPTRALAAETLTLEPTQSDLANQAYALTPAEIALMWETAPPCMPVLADP